MVEKEICNFLTQPNKDFPLDCETLDQLQSNAAMIAALGNIAGDKLILTGCELTKNNTERTPGYVFVKTKDFPEGEVLPWSGGNISEGMHIALEDVAVTANGYEYPKAYTRRKLTAGVGAENFSWDDFKKPKTPAELEQMIATLKQKQENFEQGSVSEPLGVIKMWAGKVVPENYELCNGKELKAEEYPDLYAALGTMFNTGVDSNGTHYTTQSGYFRLPDLRGRFIVGYHDTDVEYSGYGKAGGEKKHKLTIDEMPSHNHQQNLHPGASGDWKSGGEGSWPNATTNHGTTEPSGNTAETGGSFPHENRPPFYTLAYIIKVK